VLGDRSKMRPYVWVHLDDERRRRSRRVQLSDKPANEGTPVGGRVGFGIFTLRERPDLRPAIFLPDLQSVWPEFMRHDTTAELYFAPSQFEAYLDYAFAGVVDGKVVARAFSVPFAFNVDGRDELPDGGWDQVIRWAHEDRMIGRASTALSALEITLVPEARGGGNSIALLNAMKCCARANGYTALFAPVRPNQKHLRQHISMREYISEMRADGLPLTLGFVFTIEPVGEW